MTNRKETKMFKNKNFDILVLHKITTTKRISHIFLENFKIKLKKNYFKIKKHETCFCLK